MAYRFKWMTSPIGRLKLVTSDRGLVAILWEHDKRYEERLRPITEKSDHPILKSTERQLREYFAGKRTHFDVPLDFNGTEFQQKVWAALLTIPFGETRSYADIARQIGNPRAVRAVGQAANRNPIAVIAPCHRVIGASGKLTGFAGGLEVKELLLDIERLGDAAKSPESHKQADQSSERPRENATA